MKIAVYTRDGRRASSSYYRIIQYFDHIKLLDGFDVYYRFFCPTLLTKLQYNTSGFLGILVRLIYHFFVLINSVVYFTIDIFHPKDCVVILRSITPKTCFGFVSRLYFRMLKKSKKVIWDFDDDIFKAEIGDREKSIIFSNVDQVVVTHDYLKSLLPKELHEKTLIVPTTDGDFCNDDYSNYIANRITLYNSSFIVVWLASSAGLDDLYEYADAIDLASEIIRKDLNKDVYLYAICNKPVNYEFHNTKLINIKWNRKKAIELLNNAHVGIMPLRNTKFNLGKGGFKMIQYYAAGLPAIGSNIGYNSKVIFDDITGYLVDKPDDWINAFVKLASEKDRWLSMCKNAKSTWIEKYNFEDNLNIWIDMLVN